MYVHVSTRTCDLYDIIEGEDVAWRVDCTVFMFILDRLEACDGLCNEVWEVWGEVWEVLGEVWEVWGEAWEEAWPGIESIGLRGLKAVNPL